MILIDGFPIDCAVSVEVVRDSVITSHPVEAGADVTDHVRNNPITVNLDCLISNTPMAEIASLRDGIPSEEGRAKLLAIRAAREPVSIELIDETLDSMVLQNLTTPKTVQTGDALSFRATFVEVVLQTNQRTTVPVLVPRSSKKRDLGAKGATDKADPKAKVRSSATWDLLHGESVTSDIVDDVLGAL